MNDALCRSISWRGRGAMEMDDALALTTALNTLAAAVAAQIEDNSELTLLAAALTQLGDTLATIAALRAQQNACRETMG